MLGVITRNGMRGHRGRFINSPLSAGGIEPNLPRRSDAGRRPTATRSPPTRDRRTSTARTRRARGGGRSAETRRADPGRCAIFRIFSRGVQRAAPRRGAGRDTRRTSQRVPGNRGNLVAPVVRESHGKDAGTWMGSPRSVVRSNASRIYNSDPRARHKFNTQS